MKMLLMSAVAAVAAAGIAPALAQVPAPPSAAAPHHRMRMMKPITRAEVVQMVQARFARIDANHDGFITRDEEQGAMQAMHAKMQQRMAKRADGFFDRLDTNHDGVISRAEFDAARAAREQRMAQAGGVHGGMAGMHHAGFAPMHGGFGGRMFDMADANHDGRVSLQEATEAALRHFDSMDTNHDGVVTPDEMRAAHQRIHPKG